MYVIVLLFVLVATPAWAIKSLDLPASMEHDRDRIETAVEWAEEVTYDLCLARKYLKLVEKGKLAKAEKKCRKKLSKIKVTCIDDIRFKCGNGFCGGLQVGKKTTAACQREDVQNIFVHEFCHVIAGPKSGHDGVLECASK